MVLSATFMSLFDIFVVNVAAPSIQRDLHASSATLELVVAGYSFSYAAGLVTGARLGDLVGRRRMFMIGLGIFAAASLLSGVAPTSTILVVGRLAQGFGAAAMIPQVLSLLTTNFRPDERPRVFSLFGVTVGLGTVAGQILGGVLLDLNLFGWGWRSIFLVNVPIGIAAIVLARRLLPESRPDVADRLDPLGVVLLTTGVGAITAPLVLGQADGWPLWTWISFAAGAALVGSFLWWENRLGRPRGPAAPSPQPLRAPGVQRRAPGQPRLLLLLRQRPAHPHPLPAGRAPLLPHAGRTHLCPAGRRLRPLVAARPPAPRAIRHHHHLGGRGHRPGRCHRVDHRRQCVRAVGHIVGALSGPGPDRRGQRAGDPAHRLRRPPERAPPRPPGRPRGCWPPPSSSP